MTVVYVARQMTLLGLAWARLICGCAAPSGLCVVLRPVGARDRLIRYHYGGLFFLHAVIVGISNFSDTIFCGDRRKYKTLLYFCRFMFMLFVLV